MVHCGSGLAFSLAFGVQALGLSPTIPKTQIIGFKGPNTIILMYLDPKPPPPPPAPDYLGPWTLRV